MQLQFKICHPPPLFLLLIMALPALLEALNFSDVGADIMEALQTLEPGEAQELLTHALIVGGTPAAAQNIIGGIISGGLSTSQTIGSNAPRLRRHRRIVPIERMERSFSHMPFRRRISTGPMTRAQTRSRTRLQASSARTIQRVGKKYVFRKRLRQYGRANLNMLARASPAHKTQTVVKRLQNAPSATTVETGGSVSSFIQNAGSKTTPDGQFAFSYAFKLDQMYNYSEFTTAYQWYKILGVKLIFYPAQNSYRADDGTTFTSSASGTIFARAPFLIVAPDSSSDALFGSANEASAHAGAVMHCFNDGADFSVYCNPKPTSLVGSAGSEVQTLGTERPWISTASATVKHYGLRCFADQFGDSSLIRAKAIYTVAFKGLKS